MGRCPGGNVNGRAKVFPLLLQNIAGMNADMYCRKVGLLFNFFPKVEPYLDKVRSIVSYN
jgi:hypothetical protein